MLNVTFNYFSVVLWMAVSMVKGGVWVWRKNTNLPQPTTKLYRKHCQ